MTNKSSHHNQALSTPDRQPFVVVVVYIRQQHAIKSGKLLFLHHLKLRIRLFVSLVVIFGK